VAQRARAPSKEIGRARRLTLVLRPATTNSREFNGSSRLLKLMVIRLARSGAPRRL
jgi:hypothetical protein